MKANVPASPMPMLYSQPSVPTQTIDEDIDEHNQPDDYYGCDNETLVWWCRMGVRLMIPSMLLALPAVARAVLHLTLAVIVAFAVGLPFVAALAAMTWRRLQHPTPARRFEPSAANNKEKTKTSEEEEEEEEKEENSGGSAGGAAAAAGVGTDDRVIRKVAVIGGGAAGLAALRQLRDRGMDAVLFERSGDVGGLWAGACRVAQQC
jgi:hypothetical protein